MVQNEMLYYCFYDDYQKCIQHDLVRRYCKLCQINQTFTDFEEILRENKYNKPFMIRYAHGLFVDVIECVKLKNYCMQVFYGNYSFRHRDWYTGETNSVSLSKTLK